MLLGVPLGGLEDSVIKSCCYASNLDHLNPTREEARILRVTAKAEGDCHEANKDLWLNQVEDKWDKFMF